MKLRALEPSDLDLLYAFENDPSEWQFSATTAPFSRWVLKQFIQRSLREDVYALKQMRLLAETTVENERKAVAFVDLSEFSPQHRRAEVGIAVLPVFRNRGLGKQALQLLCEYAKRSLSLHQLYAYVAEDNTASQHLFQSSGFERQALLQDWFLHDGCFKNAVLYQKRL